MKDLENFLEAEVHDGMMELAESIYIGVVGRTPVRTGNLRASWNLSQGQPDTSIVTEGTVSNPLPAPNLPKLAPSGLETIYISNYQHYAQYIEAGWSSQAPAGMLDVTLADHGLL